MPVKLNIFRMMAHAEANMIPAMRLGNSILHRQKLSAVHRELLILQVAQLEGGAYEWRQHVPIALGVRGDAAPDRWPGAGQLRR
jgi:alkylhydroperoxidase family enzyme